MHMIGIEDLKREHLRDFWSIEAATSDGAEGMRVGTSSRLPPITRPEVKGTEQKNAVCIGSFF